MLGRKPEKIKLGDYVVDSVTGYEGQCVGIMKWLNGCRRIGIQSKERNNETGLPVDLYWVDETTVSVKKKQVLKTTQRERGGSNSISKRYEAPKY